jgi:nucleolar protein 14
MNAQIENASAPKMPNRDSLILFHMIGRIFSTSDYHHIVVTPTQLLMSAYLGHGRMTKPCHLLSALFMMQTMLNYQKISKRIVPELFGLLGPLLTMCFGLKHSGWSQYSEDRYISRSVHDLLGQELTSVPSARAISFEDLTSTEDEPITKEMIASFLLHILKETVELYQDNVAAPELFISLLQMLESCPMASAVAQPLLETIGSNREARKPLQLQKSKPIAIPQLIPDLDDGPNREEREQNMLKRQYKRELKGAKKELKKDSAFLAQQKLQMRLEADRKYQDRQRQILGSISNETSHDAKRRRK